MAHLLFLTPQLPYPPHQGTSLRNFHILQGVAGQHDITLLSYLEENQTAVPEAIAPLAEICRQIVTVPVPARSRGRRLRQLLTTRRPDMAHRLFSPEFNTQLQPLLARNRFDVVQVEGIELARTMAAVRVVSKGSKIVFDNHNAETELQRRNMLTDWGQLRRWPAAAYSWVQVGRLARFERWACLEADWITAVSEADKQHLQALLPGRSLPVTVIPNCIDVTRFQTPPETAVAFDLLFTGKMDYRPNVDAVLWFADAVWPLIKAARPATTWAIVGQKPHPRLERLRALEGVTLTGWVEAVRPYLAGAAVFVMPFRIGSGTRLKLIEAMAAGSAIVSTPVGAEGYPVQDGRELLLADTPAAWATAVAELLADPARRAKLGETARQFATAYDWRVVVPRFNQIYDHLLR